MIELIILEYLRTAMDVNVYMEEPKGEELPEEYILIEKTGSSESDYVCQSSFAFQSYSDSLYGAARLNMDLINAMDGITSLDSISRAALNGDYNYTDTSKKKYRYQAVYEITYFRR